MAVTAHPSRLRVGSPDYLIMATVGVLVVLGILAVYSSSFALGLLEFGDANYFVFRQVFFAFLGGVAMWALMKTDYRRLRLFSPLLMLAAIIGLVAVLVPGIGAERNGATRWIAIGGPIPPVQPSEFAKLALIIYVSAWLAGRGETVKNFWLGFVPCVVLVGIVAGLVMLEPDLGTAIVLVLTTITLVFVAGASLTHVVAFLGSGGVVASMLIAAGDYRTDRIFAFIRAEDDPSGRGFQTLQLLIALGSGGVRGLGLGASRQKFFYVPGAHTDGIFAIIGEELGFVGAAIVLLLFAFLIVRCFRVIVRARDDFGSLLGVGIVSWIGYQAIINIGGITRTLPLTGIPLPFLSYGGSALMAMLAGVGILLSVSRFGVDPQNLAPRPRPVDGSETMVRPARKTGAARRSDGRASARGATPDRPQSARGATQDRPQSTRGAR
ncbi:MAG: putative lipid II flippase FtsW [Chloroflexi bacterium]|nr:putative lipid II flippase FtsW [Chloroflexota bacterium]